MGLCCYVKLLQCNPDIRELLRPDNKSPISEFLLYSGVVYFMYINTGSNLEPGKNLLYPGFSYIRVWTILYTLTQALIWDQEKISLIFRFLLYPGLNYFIYINTGSNLGPGKNLSYIQVSLISGFELFYIH